jgi:hypothetical protein
VAVSLRFVKAINLGPNPLKNLSSPVAVHAHAGFLSVDPAIPGDMPVGISPVPLPTDTEYAALVRHQVPAFYLFNVHERPMSTPHETEFYLRHMPLGNSKPACDLGLVNSSCPTEELDLSNICFAKFRTGSSATIDLVCDRFKMCRIYARPITTGMIYIPANRHSQAALLLKHPNVSIDLMTYFRVMLESVTSNRFS